MNNLTSLIVIMLVASTAQADPKRLEQPRTPTDLRSVEQDQPNPLNSRSGRYGYSIPGLGKLDMGNDRPDPRRANACAHP